MEICRRCGEQIEDPRSYLHVCEPRAQDRHGPTRFDGVEPSPQAELVFDRETETKLEKEFREYDDKNPHVYVLVKKYTFEKETQGFKNYSSDAILHRVRWDAEVRTDECPHGFKICNNHTAYYARKVMAEFPRLKGFFRTRRVKNGSGGKKD